MCYSSVCVCVCFSAHWWGRTWGFLCSWVRSRCKLALLWSTWPTAGSVSGDGGFSVPEPPSQTRPVSCPLEEEGDYYYIITLTFSFFQFIWSSWLILYYTSIYIYSHLYNLVCHPISTLPTNTTRSNTTSATVSLNTNLMATACFHCFNERYSVVFLTMTLPHYLPEFQKQSSSHIIFTLHGISLQPYLVSAFLWPLSCSLWSTEPPTPLRSVPLPVSCGVWTPLVVSPMAPCQIAPAAQRRQCESPFIFYKTCAQTVLHRCKLWQIKCAA